MTRFKAPITRVGGGGLRPPEPERGRVRSPFKAPITRVGGGGLRPPEPERGRVWEPFQGSHHPRRRRRASPAGARAREGLGTLSGFPSQPITDIMSTTETYTRVSAKLSPIPRALRQLRRPTHHQARHPSHPAPFLRNPHAGGRLRHPHHPRTARPPGREHHHDLHPRPQPRGMRGVRSPLDR